MPKVHLSNQFIKQLKNPAKRTEYYDDHLIENNKLKKSGVKGLALRITPTGKKSFVYRYWYDEKSKRFTIGSYPTISLSKARKKAKKLHREIKKGNDPLKTKKERKEDKPTTFQEAVESYKRQHLPTLKASTRSDYKARIKHLLKGQGRKKKIKSRGFDGRRYIKNIKRHEILDFINKVGIDAPTQANRLQAILSGIFKHSKDREWVSSNIASSIRIKSKQRKKGDEKKWKNVVFSEKEIQSLWRTFDEHHEPVGSYLKMLLLLGQRAGETRKLRWEDISFKKKIWTIPSKDTKNGEPNRIPLTNMAIEILNKARVWSECEFVFESQVKRGQPIGSQQKAAQRIKNKSSVKDFNMHSLRKTFGTMLAKLGTSPQVLSKILNHKKPGEGNMITAIYNKYDYEEEKRTALKKWELKLHDILNSNEEEGVTIHRIG